MCKVPYDYMYKHDPVALAEGNMLVFEYIGADSSSGTLDVYNFEAESAGAKLRFFKSHLPDFDRTELFIKSQNDFDKIKYGGIDSGRERFIIEYSKALSKYKNMPEFPSASAPWSLACNFYGMENMILLTMTEPETAHELLRRISDDLIVPAILERSAALPGHMKSITLADAACMLPMISCDIAEEFIEPYAMRVKEQVRKLSGLENLGMILGIWPSIACLKSEEERNRYLRFAMRVGSFTAGGGGGMSANGPDVDKLGINYYIDKANELDGSLAIGFAPSLTDGGKPQELFEKAKEYLLAGKRCKKPFNLQMVGIGGHTPPENIHAVVAATRTYGIPGADENTPFNGTLEMRPFEEFLKYKMENNTEGYSFKWLSKSGYAYLAN